MKNRNLDHKDDWATPIVFYEKLNRIHNFDFDPCPFGHDISLWDGLEVEWGERNYINPPYSQKLKEAFVKKAIAESKKGKLCVMLLPVSTSTKLFHEHILPNKTDIEFVSKRIPFIGINSYGQYVNWHQWDEQPPDTAQQVRNSGMHDSMVVIFDGRKITTDVFQSNMESGFTINCVANTFVCPDRGRAVMFMHPDDIPAATEQTIVKPKISDFDIKMDKIDNVIKEHSLYLSALAQTIHPPY